MIPKNKSYSNDSNNNSNKKFKRDDDKKFAESKFKKRNNYEDDDEDDDSELENDPELKITRENVDFNLPKPGPHAKPAEWRKWKNMRELKILSLLFFFSSITSMLLLSID